MVSATRTPDWSSRRALVTGHTGFKGGWLSHWLSLLGADVHGMAFDPITTPNLFEVTGVKSTLATDERGDVTDLEQVRRVLTAVQPEVVFHLAAQPLVRGSAGYSAHKRPRHRERTRGGSILPVGPRSYRDNYRQSLPK